MAEDDVNATLNESIGDRIRRIRESRGLSTADLAARVHVGEAAIKKLESGGSKAPSLQNAVRLADALGVDIWTLAFGTERPSEAKMEVDSQEITEIFRDLTAADVDRRVKRLLVLLWQAAMGHRIALREIQSALQLEQLPPLSSDPNERGRRLNG